MGTPADGANEPLALEPPVRTDESRASTWGERPREIVLAIAADPVWRDAVLPTVAIRIVLLVMAPLLVVVFHPEGLPHGDLLQIWNRWDAPHFFEIARYGYGPPADPARIVLFPLFPALIALGSLVTSPLYAGMEISFLATVAAAAGVYRLTLFDYSRRTARLAVVAMNVFPTAFAFVAPYSEAPFLALVVWALVAARVQNWPAAGFLTMLAGATRLQGAFLVPALALEYLVARRRLDRGILWLAIGVGGPLLYLAINLLTFGDPLYFVHIQDTVFHVRNEAPWVSFPRLVDAVLHADRNEYWATVYLAPLASFVLLGLVSVWTLVARDRRAGYAVFAWLNLLSLLTLNWPISVPRYILGVAPMFVWFGSLARRPSIGPAMLLLFVMILTWSMSLFVVGHWAF